MNNSFNRNFCFLISIILTSISIAPQSGLSQTPAQVAEYSAAKPEVTFASMRHDLGTLYRGQRVAKEFRFKNSGKSNLEIRSIHAACGCINPKIEPKNIFAPGEEGRVLFEFDSSWFSGQILRTLTVDSNAPQQATTILTVTADIKEEISAKPSMFELKDNARKPQDLTVHIDVMEKAKGTDTLVSVSNLAKIPTEFEEIKKQLQVSAAETKILAAIASSPLITTEILPKIGNSVPILIKFTKELPAGAFREHITIWNTSTHLKELVIPIIGEMPSHVKKSTKYLEFGIVAPDKSAKKTLSLTSDLSDFKIENISIELKKTEELQKLSDIKIITHTMKKIAEGYEIALEMQIPKDLELQMPFLNISGVLNIQTTDSDNRNIKIPFFGVLQKEDHDE